MLSRIVRNPFDSAALLRSPGRTSDEVAATSHPISFPRDLPANAGRPARTGSPGPRRKVAPEQVLQSFNTWAFKREQPGEPDLMLQAISEALQHAEPVRFVLYWGKGPRCTLDEPEIRCLDYLASLTERVRRVYEPGAVIRLIFTDTHATLNGHTPESMSAYFNAVAAGGRLHGFENCWLSDLTRDVRIDDAPDDAISEEMLHILCESARKWYRGEGTAEQGALQYYRLNMIEKRAVELAFPHSIFITFNGSEFRNLFPKNLPIFYMYSLRRGFGVKPWFLPAAPSCNASTEAAVGTSI